MKKNITIGKVPENKNDEWIVWFDDRTTEIGGSMRRKGISTKLTLEEEKQLDKRLEPIIKRFFNEK